MATGVNRPLSSEGRLQQHLGASGGEVARSDTTLLFPVTPLPAAGAQPHASGNTTLYCEEVGKIDEFGAQTRYGTRTNHDYAPEEVGHALTGNGEGQKCQDGGKGGKGSNAEVGGVKRGGPTTTAGDGTGRRRQRRTKASTSLSSTSESHMGDSGGKQTARGSGRGGTEEHKFRMWAGQSNILVAVRLRPLLKHDREQVEVAKILGNKVVVLMDPTKANGDVDPLRVNRTREKRYAFDYVFNKGDTQRAVYENTTKFLIQGVLDGFNATVFAYGCTGAGKTYTMIGTAQDGHQGIMFLTLQDLFKEQHKASLEQGMNYTVIVSFLEVYNENIRDLLNDSGEFLDLREDPIKGPTVSGISEVVTRTPEEIMGLLHQGNRSRTQQATKANDVSSRSHAVLQVVVESRDKTPSTMSKINIGKLSLVDLAGSERAAATQNRGVRLVEGANINRSLLALGNCINALGEKGNKGQFVPYRDSKLTRLLKDSLGGNCRTVMIANISGASSSFEETLNTLKYANRAKNIKTNVTRNSLSVNYHISEYVNLIGSLRTEITNLKHQLRSHRLEMPSASRGGISSATASPVLSCAKSAEDSANGPLRSPGSVSDADSTNGGRDEFPVLTSTLDKGFVEEIRKNIVENFRERMQLRRSLIELEDQNVQNSIEIGKRQLAVVEWHSGKRLPPSAAADALQGLETQQGEWAEALEQAAKNAVSGSGGKGRDEGNGGGETLSPPPAVRSAWKECGQLQSAITKNNETKRKISRRLRNNGRQAERFRADLDGKVTGEDWKQLLKLQYRIGRLELDNMELEHSRIVHESAMKGKDLAIQKLQLQLAMRDRTISHQRAILEEYGHSSTATGHPHVDASSGQVIGIYGARTLPGETSGNVFLECLASPNNSHQPRQAGGDNAVVVADKGWGRRVDHNNGWEVKWRGSEKDRLEVAPELGSTGLAQEVKSLSPVRSQRMTSSSFHQGRGHLDPPQMLHNSNPDIPNASNGGAGGGGSSAAISSGDAAIAAPTTNFTAVSSIANGRSKVSKGNKIGTSRVRYGVPGAPSTLNHAAIHPSRHDHPGKQIKHMEGNSLKDQKSGDGGEDDDLSVSSANVSFGTGGGGEGGGAARVGGDTNGRRGAGAGGMRARKRDRVKGRVTFRRHPPKPPPIEGDEQSSPARVTACEAGAGAADSFGVAGFGVGIPWREKSQHQQQIAGEGGRGGGGSTAMNRRRVRRGTTKVDNTSRTGPGTVGGGLGAASGTGNGAGGGVGVGNGGGNEGGTSPLPYLTIHPMPVVGATSSRNHNHPTQQPTRARGVINDSSSTKNQGGWDDCGIQDWESSREDIDVIGAAFENGRPSGRVTGQDRTGGVGEGGGNLGGRDQQTSKAHLTSTKKNCPRPEGGLGVGIGRAAGLIGGMASGQGVWIGGDSSAGTCVEDGAGGEAGVGVTVGPSSRMGVGTQVVASAGGTGAEVGAGTWVDSQSMARASEESLECGKVKVGLPAQPATSFQNGGSPCMRVNGRGRGGGTGRGLGGVGSSIQGGGTMLDATPHSVLASAESHHGGGEGNLSNLKARMQGRQRAPAVS